MSRIRSIKPEFWTSEQVVECSTNARLLFIGMWNFCDDRGIHPASAKRLKMEVFPADDFTLEQIDGWVSELIQHGLTREYKSMENGTEQTFWLVTGWHHQKIERPTYKYPEPPKDTAFDKHSSNDRRRVVDHSTTHHPRNGTESKGSIPYENEKSSSADSLIWKTGVALCTDAGCSNNDARSFLGKYIKQDKEKLAKLIAQIAIKPVLDPKSYIAAAMRPSERKLVL